MWLFLFIPRFARTNCPSSWICCPIGLQVSIAFSNKSKKSPQRVPIYVEHEQYELRTLNINDLLPNSEIQKKKSTSNILGIKNTNSNMFLFTNLRYVFVYWISLTSHMHSLKIRRLWVSIYPDIFYVYYVIRLVRQYCGY